MTYSFTVLTWRLTWYILRKSLLDYNNPSGISGTVTAEGVAVDPSKIECIKAVETTLNIEGVESIYKIGWLLQEVCKELAIETTLQRAYIIFLNKSDEKWK